MGGTIISGEGCQSGQNAKYKDPEEEMYFACSTTSKEPVWLEHSDQEGK